MDNPPNKLASPEGTTGKPRTTTPAAPPGLRIFVAHPHPRAFARGYNMSPLRGYSRSYVGDIPPLRCWVHGPRAFARGYNMSPLRGYSRSFVGDIPLRRNPHIHHRLLPHIPSPRR